MSDTPPGPPYGSTPPPPPPPPGGLTPPPGYTTYPSGGYGGYAEFRRVGRLGGAIRVLVIISSVGALLSAFVSLGVTSAAKDYLNGVISEDDFIEKYAPTVLLSAVYGLTALAAGIVTMIWMYRMASNLRALGRHGQTWAPGWGIGGWFAPPFVFVIPWLMLGELWKGSDPQIATNADGWKRGAVGPVVHLWWVLYGLAPLAFTVIGLSSFLGSGFGGDTLDVAERLSDQQWISFAASLVQVASGLAFVVLVRRLSERHMACTSET